jgi:hypothetical protein
MSIQYSALSIEPNLFTAKNAKDAKQESKSNFISFALSAPFAVNFLG